MPLTSERFFDLFSKHQRGELSNSEELELNQWLAESVFNRETFERLSDPEEVRRTYIATKKAEEETWKYLQEQIPELAAPTKQDRIIFGNFRPWVKYVAVASVVLLLIAGAIWLIQLGNDSPTVADQRERFGNDVPAPVGIRAALTLADGTKLELDNTGNGTVANQGTTQVTKQDDRLVYQPVGETQQAQVLYNTLSTEKGGLYQLTLPDGSKVWINSASILTFPTAFTGKERRVTLMGEAYFEVTKNPSKKFYVDIGGSAVEVIGTSFNVDAYKDEKTTKITLLEGTVKVKLTNDQHATLQPGEQAVIQTLPGNTKINVAEDVDPTQVLDWKSGVFNIKENDIHTIMGKVKRWYDVEVVYAGEIEKKHFVAEIKRNEPLSELLKLLENTGAVHFKIEGRTVTVMP